MIDPLAREAFVLGAVDQSSLIEASLCDVVLRLEGEVMATGQCAVRCQA